MENKNQIESPEDIIDIEQYAKSGKVPEKGKKYRIKVDTTPYVVHVEKMTGEEILTLAQKIPVTKFQLNQKFHGGLVKKVLLDEVVDFTHPGVERFMTIPLDQTEG